MMSMLPNAVPSYESNVDTILTLPEQTGSRAVALFPFDWVSWTETLDKTAREIATRARQELGARSLDVRISGKATPAARAGLRALGWTVAENAVAGLSVAPAD